jgi:hypothetical protein
MTRICSTSQGLAACRIERINLLEKSLNPRNAAPTTKRLITVALAAISAITFLVIAGLLFVGVLCCPVPLIASALLLGLGAFFLGCTVVGGLLTVEAAAKDRLYRSQVLSWNNLCYKTAGVIRNG